jgi:hypothetical protein
VDEKDERNVAQLRGDRWLSWNATNLRCFWRSVNCPGLVHGQMPLPGALLEVMALKADQHCSTSLAAAVWAVNLFLLVVDEGEDREEFLAI